MIKYLLFFSLLTLVSCRQKGTEVAFNAVQYVDPQIGAVRCRWFFYTPAALPFGMAKLAPHTNAAGSEGGWAPVGYDDRQTSIEGFGHFHEFQIGGVVVMPTTGTLQTVPGTLDDPDSGYRSRFDKKDEHSEPGYYSVFLKDYGIKVELTATERVGFHRYTFPRSDHARIIFDIGHRQGESGKVTEAYARVVNQKEVEGYVETYPVYVTFCDPGNRVKMYFVARLNKTPEKTGTFTDTIVHENARFTKGINNGLFLEFKTSEHEVVEMQMGLSYTSIKNARLNLDTESAGVTFDEVHAAATKKWNDLLGRIRAEGGRREDLIKFYTGLYHALLGRGIASDVNGAYKLHGPGTGHIPLDENGRPRYHHYNTDGMWGAFWNLSQLWAMVYPDYFGEYLQSNIDFFKETGWLHDGEAAGAYVNGVQTNFQGLLIASAYNCGMRNFDWKTGYKAAFKNETDYHGRNLGNGKYDLYWFIKLGYVPYQDTTISNGWVYNFGASHTLEYAYSSYAVAEMAKNLGREDDHHLLMKQAGYWENLFDEQTKFIRPKLPDGQFIPDFDPMKPWAGFQEGNAFQYTWYVPHDPAALIDKLGLALFNERLEKTFIESRKSIFGGGKKIDSFSGLQKLYNQGNQPCLHQPWLFNYSGRPWLTQNWTRLICDEFYGTTPLHGYGYGQDEDQGQLGAWYVMAALGLFDVQGLTAVDPVIQLGSPQFGKVTIQLENDPERTLVIVTKNNSLKNRFVQEVRFNGENIENCWIPREELMKGGVLVFQMDSVPNKKWGIKTPPPSMSTEK